MPEIVLFGKLLLKFCYTIIIRVRSIFAKYTKCHMSTSSFWYMFDYSYCLEYSCRDSLSIRPGIYFSHYVNRSAQDDPAVRKRDVKVSSRFVNGHL